MDLKNCTINEYFQQMKCLGYVSKQYLNLDNAKIYKITSTQTPKIYINSTTVHIIENAKSELKKYINRHQNCIAKEVLQYKDAKITLIEEFPCQNTYELALRTYYQILLHDNVIYDKYTTKLIHDFNTDLYCKVIKYQLYQNKDYYKTKPFKETLENDKINFITNKNCGKIALKRSKIHCDICNIDMCHDYKGKHENTKAHRNNSLKK